jgi:predicted nucleotidyltransferase
MDFDGRIPDYAVRLENLYEDYSKIPFIVESEYYKSGELKKAITQKVNVSNEDETLWKKFYTQEIADIVYYRMPRYFDLFGYDKNSWKK